MVFDALKEWNPWWESEKLIETLIGLSRIETRSIIEYIDEREIKIISGVRRSGKSTILYQMIWDLLNKKVKPENILLINFEDRKFNGKDIDELFNLYQRKLNPVGKLYVLFDEIQNAEEWSHWIRKKYDLSKNISFTITGSSSSLLKKEYSTLLTGRNISFNIMPLNFKEFLEFKGFQIKNIELITSSTKNRLFNALEEYMRYGGFPEIVLKKKILKSAQLNQYFDDIINKDVVARYDLSSIKAFDLAKYLLTNTGNYFSFRSARSFTKLGMETLERYLSKIIETYLIYLVPIFSYSVKDQMQYPRKIYCIDTGLQNTVSFKFSKDIGRLSENVVFLQLKRNYKEPIFNIFYWKDRQGREVDFIIKEGLNVGQLIQVCFDIEDEKTKTREINSLLGAMKEFKLREGLVITEDYEGEEEFKGGKIKFIPLWRWLLK